MIRFNTFALAVSLTLVAPLAFASPLPITGTFTTSNSYSGSTSGGNISFTFNGNSENAGAGNFVGSYYKTTGGVTTNFSEVFCVDLYDQISLLSTYNANVDTAGQVKGATVNDDGQIAYLLLNPPALTTVVENEAMQAAIWELEYGASFVLSSSYNGTALDTDYLADLAIAEKYSNAADQSDVAKLDWITPINSNGTYAQAQVGVSSTTPLGQGTPPVTVTPEPGSLVLLGTGLLGVAGAARRRFKA